MWRTPVPYGLWTSATLFCFAGAVPKDELADYRIPDKVATGTVLGKSFVLKRAVLESEGAGSLQVGDGKADRTTHYRLSLGDNTGMNPTIEVTIRFHLDRGKSLDGTKLLWRPYANGTPEAAKQMYPISGPGKLSRGIQSVNLHFFHPGKPTSRSERFEDRIAAKIEFGALKNGRLPGRLLLVLPDSGRSYVVGTFVADYKVNRRHVSP